MINAKDATSKWFVDPLNASFEESGFLFSLLDGSVKFVRECSDGQVHLAGGCGITVEDIEAQGSMWLGYFHNGISVKTAFDDMELEEGGDPEAVAKGYLYPPLPGNPLDNAVMDVLQAIVDEDLALFDRSCEGIRDWNFKDPARISLVHHASRAKNPAILRKLIQKGANLMVMDTQGFSPLHFAAASNSPECIRLLVKHCPSLIESRGEDGETPLYVAVQHGAIEGVDALLSLGANPNALIVNDLSPLLWATQAKNAPIAMRLLGHGDIDFDHALKDRTSALEFAVEMEETQVLRRLIELGANVNRKSRGYTPLHLAIATGSLSGVRILLECPETITTDKTVGGESPLRMAKRLGRQDITNLLIQYKVN